MIVMMLVAAILAAAALWHFYLLPSGAKAADAPSSLRAALATTGDAWASFFRKPRVWMMITTVFFLPIWRRLHREDRSPVPDGHAGRRGPGTRQHGPCNINGKPSGRWAFVGGTLLGGLLAARYNLAAGVCAVGLALNVPHVTFFLLGQALPHDLVWITCVVLIEKLGYGLGTVGMMLYMMQELSPGAIARPLCFCHWHHGAEHDADRMVSGRIQAWSGTRPFFGFVLLARCRPLSSPGLPLSGPRPRRKASHKAALRSELHAGVDVVEILVEFRESRVGGGWWGPTLDRLLRYQGAS